MIDQNVTRRNSVCSWDVDEMDGKWNRSEGTKKELLFFETDDDGDGSVPSLKTCEWVNQN